MQYIITKQIAVEAETPEEAIAKSATEGRTIGISVNERPQLPQAGGIQRPATVRP